MLRFLKCLIILIVGTLALAVVVGLLSMLLVWTLIVTGGMAVWAWGFLVVAIFAYMMAEFD